jgi:ketosteroid isomerase-like protein
MPHANELLIRRIYTAFAHGDMEGVLADCTDDVVFSIPGTNKVAGTYRGHDGFLTEFLPALAAVADMQTFQEDINALACDDDYGHCGIDVERARL